jgi:hypothetical protein
LVSKDPESRPHDEFENGTKKFQFLSPWRPKNGEKRRKTRDFGFREPLREKFWGLIQFFGKKTCALPSRI